MYYISFPVDIRQGVTYVFALSNAERNPVKNCNMDLLQATFDRPVLKTLQAGSMHSGALNNRQFYKLIIAGRRQLAGKTQS
jgi:hypothetical protein